MDGETASTSVNSKVWLARQKQYIVNLSWYLYSRYCCWLSAGYLCSGREVIIPWEWCSITSPKSFKMYPTQTARICKFYENNVQDLSCLRKLKMGSRTWSTCCGTQLCCLSVREQKEN